MYLTCLDLEGVLIPEIWIALAEKTNIDELRLTTRDIQDYDELMQKRLSILDKYNLGIREIQEVIQTLNPLPGALPFLDWLREQNQVIILSDTFTEFAFPLMQQLKMPTLFCHSLDIDAKGKIRSYKLRMKNHKAEAVKRFRELQFQVIAAGDSYNDLAMLRQADQGILFHAPDYIATENSQFPRADTFDEFKSLFSAIFVKK